MSVHHTVSILLLALILALVGSASTNAMVAEAPVERPPTYICVNGDLTLALLQDRDGSWIQWTCTPT